LEIVAFSRFSNIDLQIRAPKGTKNFILGRIQVSLPENFDPKT
jgi:hypothetical protein